MRCLVGFVLFVVLYFGGYALLGQYVATNALQTGQVHSKMAAEMAGRHVVKKYHSHLAVGVGLTVLLVCSIPTVLVKMSQRDIPWK